MKRKILPALLMLLFFPVLLAMPVSADMGPKPQVTIRVENPPEGLYYLDLLVDYQDDYPNLDEEWLETADPELLAALKSLEPEGWYPALSGGTHIPLSGKLTGEPDGDEMVHVFGYAPPDTFRIILAPENGEPVVSEVVETRVFCSTVWFDAETGEVSQQVWWLACLFQYLSTLIPTLVVEGVVFLLFGFSLKRRWDFFLVLNAATQLLLYGVLWCMGGAGAPIVGFFYYLYVTPLEILITVIEAVAFTRVLREKSRKRRIFCAIAANAASYFTGLLLAEPVFRWTSALF